MFKNTIEYLNPDAKYRVKTSQIHKSTSEIAQSR